jgi:hypothetical protein
VLSVQQCCWYGIWFLGSLQLDHACSKWAMAYAQQNGRKENMTMKENNLSVTESKTRKKVLKNQFNTITNLSWRFCRHFIAREEGSVHISRCQNIDLSWFCIMVFNVLRSKKRQVQLYISSLLWTLTSIWTSLKPSNYAVHMVNKLAWI